MTALALVAIARLIAYRDRMRNALYRNAELVGLLLGLGKLPLDGFSWMLRQAVKSIKAPYKVYMTIRHLRRSHRQPKQPANSTTAFVA